MPAPAVTYTELVNAVNAGQVGTSIRGFTIQSITVQSDDRFRIVVATRNNNTWTILYQRAPDGGRGRVLSATDNQGRTWWAAPWLDGWV